MANFFCKVPLGCGIYPWAVTHVAELKPVYLAILPVVKAAFQHDINRVSFDLFRNISPDGSLDFDIRGSFISYGNYTRTTRRTVRETGGDRFAPLLPPRGISKRLSAVMAEALVSVDLSLLAVFAANGWKFEDREIGEVERELGRDWEVPDYISTQVLLDPKSILRYFL